MDAERYRKNEQAILQALAKHGQVTVAGRLNISESKVSRLKNEGAHFSLADIAELMAALDLKCVPIEMQCYRPESIQSILTLAKERMAQLETPEQLQWEES